MTKKKIRKILFLDIDGVLNSEKWVNYCHKNHIGYNKDVYGQDRELDPSAVALIDKINEGVNGELELIISSSWRSTMEDTVARLRTQGLKCPIAGPLTHPPGKSEFEDFICRGSVIHQWLLKQRLFEGYEWCWNDEDNDYQPFTYCIIDDDEDMLYSQRFYFVNTSYRYGLTEAGAQRAIAILNAKDSLLDNNG